MGWAQEAEENEIILTNKHGKYPIVLRAGYPIAILTKRGHLSWDLLIPASDDIRYRLTDKRQTYRGSQVTQREERRFIRGKWEAIVSPGPIDAFPRRPWDNMPSDQR